MTDPTTMIKVIQSLKAFINDVILHTSNPEESPFHDLRQKA